MKTVLCPVGCGRRNKPPRTQGPQSNIEPLCSLYPPAMSFCYFAASTVFSVPFFTPLPVAFASFLTALPVFVAAFPATLPVLSASFSVPLVAVLVSFTTFFAAFLVASPNFFAAFPITLPVSAADFAVSFAPDLAASFKDVPSPLDLSWPELAVSWPNRTAVHKTPTRIAPHFIFIGCSSSSGGLVLEYAAVPQVGANQAHADSLSRALRVSSSTSHFFRIVKIVFVAKPARASCRNIRAVCFWSFGFCSRFLRRYSRACFSSLTPSYADSIAFSITVPWTPRVFNSVSTRRL